MDLSKIKSFIHKRHVPINALANELSMSRQSLYLKLNGMRDFKIDEISQMAIALRMTPSEVLDIFFNMEVTNNGQ